MRCHIFCLHCHGSSPTHLLGDDEGDDSSIVDDLSLHLHFLLEGQRGVQLQGNLAVGEHSHLLITW